MKRNAIYIITPFKLNGMWVFTDPSRGLVNEPFVAGADTVIDMGTAHIPDASLGFNLLFSSNPFPTHQLSLRRTGKGGKHMGNTYVCEKLGLTAWLCPALYRYYERAPKTIYAEFAPLVRDAETKQTTALMEQV